MSISYAYLREVWMRFKIALGGGSLLLIAVGVMEHFIRDSISWQLYLWISIGVLILAIMTHGSDLHGRLAPKIKIQNLTRRQWPAAQHGFTGAEYYFEVFNASHGLSLENARVELVAMTPDAIGFLPVPLKIKHDDYESREFSVNPGSARPIDLLTGPVAHSSSQQSMILTHTVNKERVPIPHGKYRLTVRVSGKNTPPETAYFEAWVSDEGELRCIQL